MITYEQLKKRATKAIVKANKAEEKGNTEAEELYRKAAREYAKITSLLEWQPDQVDFALLEVQVLEMKARRSLYADFIKSRTR